MFFINASHVCVIQVLAPAHAASLLAPPPAATERGSILCFPHCPPAMPLPLTCHPPPSRSAPWALPLWESLPTPKIIPKIIPLKHVQQQVSQEILNVINNQD